jgi:hypothetical protein
MVKNLQCYACNRIRLRIPNDTEFLLILEAIFVTCAPLAEVFGLY